MPRTRKKIKWMVVVDTKVVTDIISRTYDGACFKAFKKLGLMSKAKECTKTLVKDPMNPIKVQYETKFPGTYCIPQ